MLENINWDTIFNWKLWQIMKWITGSIILISLIILIYLNNVYKQRIAKLEEQASWNYTALSKVLFDSRVTNKEALEIIKDYVERMNNN